MPVKILIAYETEELEKIVNEFLENEPLITKPKFHYSSTSYGYVNRSNNDRTRQIFSVLISW